MPNDILVNSRSTPQEGTCTGSEVSMDDLSHPDSRTCLSLTYQVDDGSEYGDTSTSYLKGERAEHLPTILKHLEAFLNEVGFDVSLSSTYNQQAPMVDGGLLQVA